MARRRRVTPDTAAILVDLDALPSLLGESIATAEEDDDFEAMLDVAPIGVFVFSGELPLLPPADFTSPRAMRPDPSSPTGWRNMQGDAINPETGEVVPEEPF